MFTIDVFQIASITAVFVIAALSTYTDIKTRKIPNVIPIVGCIL